MLPILIIGYLRPRELRACLERFVSQSQKIYIFIDFAGEKNRSLNQEVINCALEFTKHENVKIMVAQTNLGVAKAVPAAIDWITQIEVEFIVLEDDCQLNFEGLSFFNQNKGLLDHRVSLLCATSPWDYERTSISDIPISLSRYPLISGWATSSANWKELSTYIGKRPPYLKAFRNMAMYPRKAKSISFFLASQIRVYRGSVEAWDSSVALWMILNSKNSLIPNITMVTNTGRDEVAAHTLPGEGDSRIFRQESLGAPSPILDFSTQRFIETNKEIEYLLYKMKRRHILSPLKAILEGFIR